MVELSKMLKWITPFTVDVKFIRTENYLSLKCYTLTNKASLNLIKLALMKAKIEFEESPQYIIGKDCAFMAYKNKADEINLIFNAAD